MPETYRFPLGTSDADILRQSYRLLHDVLTEEWVDAEAAVYVPTLSVASPMGHGIFAFADRAGADGFAHDVGGEVIDWATVLLLPVTDGLVGDHHAHDMGDEHMHDMNEMEDMADEGHDHGGDHDMEDSG